MLSRGHPILAWTFAALALVDPVCARNATAQSAEHIRVQASSRQLQVLVTATQIVASQGNDETLQRVAVDIWGRLRDSSTFRVVRAQLDGDPEIEVVVVSRNEGTGPYYRLQIVASRTQDSFRNRGDDGRAPNTR